MLDCLLCGHWAWFYWNPSLGEGGGSDGTVSHFNAKGCLAEFQVLKTLTCGLSYPADLLLYWGYEHNDISFTCRKGQHTATCTADKNRGMWLLHWSGNRVQCCRRVVFAREIHGFAGKERFDDGQPLCKARDAYTGLVKRNAELLVVELPVACAQSKFYTTIAELIQRGYFSGEQGNA